MQLSDINQIQGLAGTVLEPTEWLTIDQSRVNTFADCTEDHQFIHVDPERAAVTPFGGTIAHGFLSLSLLAHFGEAFGIRLPSFRMAINYGLDRVRFLAPVRVGSEVRARASISDIQEKSPGAWLVRYEVEIEIRGEDKPALKATWLVMQVTGPDA